jgi:cysteinyl-tRNA synthetase
MLKIYNSLTRGKTTFVPIAPPKVGLYVCGMTVYDFCHLGHARVLVAFDIVQRWLRASGYQLTYVRNITDIDDKIIKRASENGETVGALTERFIRAMDDDAAALGVAKPDFEPRATQYIDDMQAMIGRLRENGLAYTASDGDVNFSVRKFPGYGRLSGKSLEDLRAGERVEVGTAKQDPLDFVLWKRAKEGEPFWKSPWGAGRPGWHIECSAMSTKLLGEHFDIHGGGQDLQFPHHENEIAQSEGGLPATGERHFVNTWMHNGFVRIDNEKMSKSLGNSFFVREVFKRYDPEVVRFFIARAHYRSPLNYADQHMDDARGSLGRLYTALKDFPATPADVDWNTPHAIRFREAMDDDFNTPEAMAVLFDMANEINKAHSSELAAQLRALGGLLGLLGRDSAAFLKATAGSADADALTYEQIETLIEQRAGAKKVKNFAEADRIRAELAKAGVVLEDAAGGTTWRRA